MLTFIPALTLPMPSSRPSRTSAHVPLLMTSAPPSSSSDSDLLVIGAGDLGVRVASLWRTHHPFAMITGETKTSRMHNYLHSQGIIPTLPGDNIRAPRNIVFCAPPHGNPHYIEQVSDALHRLPPDGRIIYTSSLGVHGDATSICEDTPVSVATARSATLARCEDVVRSHPRGMVIRLAGLYSHRRGSFLHWLLMGSMPVSEDHTVNMLHYDDAARAVVSALLLSDVEVEELVRKGNNAFLAVVREILSPRELYQAVLQHPLGDGKRMPTFSAPLGEEKALKRRFDSSWTRQTLQWTPQWESFVEFMRTDAARTADVGDLVAQSVE